MFTYSYKKPHLRFKHFNNWYENSEFKYVLYKHCLLLNCCLISWLITKTWVKQLVLHFKRSRFRLGKRKSYEIKSAYEPVSPYFQFQYLIGQNFVNETIRRAKCLSSIEEFVTFARWKLSQNESKNVFIYCTRKAACKFTRVE